MAEENIGQKLAKIEDELKSIHLVLTSGAQTHKNKKIVKLEGALKGLHIIDEDIKEAKNALFRTEE